MGSHRFSMRLAGSLALLLALAALDSVPARAGVDSWTPFGPGQSRLVSVAASSRGDLFAVAAFGDLAEVWQLPAGTSTWRWRNGGLGRPQVRALAVHPTRPNQLWAISGSPLESVYRSDDAGASWRLVSTAGAGFHALALWVVPAGSSPVLVADTVSGVGRKLARSNDGGGTWSPMPGAAGPVAVAGDQPGVIFAAAEQGGGVMRSRDRGLTFSVVRSPGVSAGDDVRALHVTRGRKPLVFASFRTGGLFRSADGTRLDRVGFAGGGPSAVASDPRNSQLVYATTAAGLYASSRAGRAGSFSGVVSWGFGLPIAEPTALIVPPVGPLFLTGGDLLDSRLNSLAETGMAGFGASELRVATADAAAIAVREYTQCTPQCDLRTFLSHDGGASYIRRGIQFLPHAFADARDLAFDPASSRRWLEISTGAVLVDSGSLRLLTPTVVNTPPTAVEIAAGGALLVGAGGGVLVSRDDGASWTATLGNPVPFPATNVVDLRTDVAAADRVLAMVVQLATVDPPAPAKLLAYRSVDAATHWSPVLPNVAGLLDVEPVLGAPTGLFALFAAAGGSELRRSDDGGTTSVPVHTFTTAEVVSDVVGDAVAPNVLYAASANGLLRSRDGGATWESTPGTLDAWGPYRRRLQRLWVHPTERGHVYAAPADGGLFENRSSD